MANVVVLIEDPALRTSECTVKMDFLYTFIYTFIYTYMYLYVLG